MNSASMATNLLGRTVKLKERPVGKKSDLGRIATVFIDGQGVHYVILLEGELIRLEASQFTVLD